MKKLLGAILAILMLPVCTNAIDFYDDGWITDGNVFDTVNIWNDANVTMIGGEAFYCNLYDSSIFNAYGGDTSVLYTHQTSHAWLYADDATGAYIYDQSVVHIFNGGPSQSMFIYDNGQLHIYGYHLEYDELAAPNWVTGYWEDGQEFWIYLRNIYTYNPEQVFLHEIPEPSTFCIMSLLTLFIRKRGD